MGRTAQAAAKQLAQSPAETRRAALEEMAAALERSAEEIIDINRRDVGAAKGSISDALVDRLTLTDSRLASMSRGLRDVAGQPDPVGELIEQWIRPNGLKIQKIRKPLGVIAVIYEARPNVTADVAGLCVMSGNAAILRGSSHALQTNMCVSRILREAAAGAGLPADSIQLVQDTSHEAALELMKLKGLVDLIIPRGGPALIQAVEQNAEVPYIIDGDGNCHVYVDKSADQKMATEIIVNAKTSKPSVCNAAETLLVHADMAADWLPAALDRLKERGVEIRGDERVRKVWPEALAATESDWATEYLDLILAVRVVDSIEDAVEHVNRWGTSNAESIVTGDEGAAEMFAQQIDSGTVFVNASTRFSDGGEFGFGSEIGISTQKLHARGPLGLKELTSGSYVVWGEGQVKV